MAQETKSYTSFLIHFFIMFALMCSGWFLPHGAALTEYGVRITMIFWGCVWGWIFVGLVEPSLLSLLFLVLAGAGTAKEIVGAGFGSEIIILIVFFSIFTKWLEDIGLTETMAKWLLSRKFLSVKPYLFILMLFAVTFLCGFFVGIYATIFLIWGICYKLLTSLGFEKRSKESCFILIGTAFVSIMGMTVMPWSPWSLMGLNGLKQATGSGVEFISYSSFMIAISLVSVLLFTLLGKIVLRLDMSKLKNQDSTRMATNLHVTKEQKLGMVLLIILWVALYIPSVLPDNLLKTILSAQGAVGIVIAFIVLLCVICFDKKPTLDFIALAKHSIPWNMICLLSAVGPLGTALMSQETGFTKTILGILKPLMASQSPLTFYVVTIVVACILTQFMNNTILLVVLTPMLCTISGMIGANPTLICALLIFGLTAALATPGASSRAGLVYGNSEWIDTKQAYIQAILSVVAVILALLLVGIPLGSLLF